MLNDEEVKGQLRSSNEQFRELEASHHQLEDELNELLKHPILTPQEELLKKQLQKEKLGKKDMMAELIRQFRESPSQSTV
ncbi:MAG: DUF465 domain-containing protein [Nitrospirales bacterium]|nr:DUF465 domain-containing protein [Nitrospirales bacterium]